MVCGVLGGFFGLFFGLYVLGFLVLLSFGGLSALFCWSCLFVVLLLDDQFCWIWAVKCPKNTAALFMCCLRAV